MIRFRGRSLELHDGETVLDCLERSGERVPSSCRSGVCQTCLMQATSGEIPAESQRGLKPSLANRGYLLACACRPTADLELASGGPPEYPSKVLACDELAPDVVRLFLERPPELSFEAGQFVQLVRPDDGLVRPYSLASLPSEPMLELHIAVRPRGNMSRWLADAVGEVVALRGPLGDCSYQCSDPGKPLLLVGTGTGLAPLLGVLKDALARGHHGPIAVHHGSRTFEGLYQWQLLTELDDAHENLNLTGWIDEPAAIADPRLRMGRIERTVVTQFERIREADIYLCGNPALVAMLKKHAYLQGASLHRIHSDPFVTARAAGAAA